MWVWKADGGMVNLAVATLINVEDDPPVPDTGVPTRRRIIAYLSDSSEILAYFPAEDTAGVEGALADIGEELRRHEGFCDLRKYSRDKAE